MMEEAIELLHSGDYSCVIKNGTEIRTFSNRGVSDIYALYQAHDDFTHGATIADKVVGKAAASLMVLLEFKKVYADIISTPALNVLKKAGIAVEFLEEVPVIINRTKTGSCPLELLTKDTVTPEEALPIITDFINSIKNLNK